MPFERLSTKGLPYPVVDDPVATQELAELVEVSDAYSTEQWATDIVLTGGLTYAYKGGVVFSGGVYSHLVDGTVTLAASDVNYVERDANGSVTVNQVAFTNNKLPMAKVTTDVAGITELEDWRVLETPAAATVGSHVVATTIALGPSHSVSGLSSGMVLRATGATTSTYGFLIASDIPSLAASKITTGTLVVARGGTGVSSPTSGNLLVGAGSSAMTLLAPGAVANYVRSTGSAWAASALLATDLTGTVPSARLVGVYSGITGLGAQAQTLDMNSQAIANVTTLNMSGVLTSTVNTGTAPFTITSTTVVTNFNADRLDAQHGAFYQNASNLNAGTVLSARMTGVYSGVTGLGVQSQTLDMGTNNITNVGTLTTSGDVTIGSLGIFDATSAPSTDYILRYNGTKWISAFLHTQFLAGDGVSQINGDGTTSAFVYSNPTLSGAPSPNPSAAPVVTATHKAILIDMSAYTLGPNEAYVLDYDDGGGYTANAIITTGANVVHATLDTGKTYAYKYRIRGGSDTPYSPAAGAIAPLNDSSAHTFGIVLAAQVVTTNLAAIHADLGDISAGQIRNAANTKGVLLSGVLPGGWTQYIDFVATGNNAFIKHPSLTLEADGGAVFSGDVASDTFAANAIAIGDEASVAATILINAGAAITGTGGAGGMMFLRGSYAAAANNQTGDIGLFVDTQYKPGGFTGLAWTVAKFDFEVGTGGGTLTNGKAVYIGAPIKLSGTVTNMVALDIGSVTVGTNNWAIRTSTGLVDFGDTVSIGDATPGDDFNLLRFNTSRPWRFETDGADGASQLLMLRPESAGKEFRIGSDNGTVNVRFIPNNTPASGLTKFLTKVECDADVGIGVTPTERLHVYDDVNGYTARIHNDGNNANRSALLLQYGRDNGAGVNTGINFTDGDGDSQGSVTHNSGTVSYNAFTASHDVSVPWAFNANGYPYGTIMVITGIRYKQKRNGATLPRGIEYDVVASTVPNAQDVLGVYAGKYVDSRNRHQVHVLGDGHMLVNNENGDIAVGDPITTSSTEGVGMKAIVGGLVCGVAQEAKTFNNSHPVLIVVQYGLRYFPAP